MELHNSQGSGRHCRFEFYLTSDTPRLKVWRNQKQAEITGNHKQIPQHIAASETADIFPWYVGDHQQMFSI